MSRFKNRDEQQLFIRDSDQLYTVLINSLSADKQVEAKHLVDQHYVTWKKILQLPSENNLSQMIDKDVIRIEKLYDEVRNSVKFTDDISIQPNSQTDQNTVDACISNILDLKNTEKQNRRCERIIQCRLGGEIHRLRKLCKTKKHFEMVVKESLEYSASYAYFLMRLHEACNEFINLKFTTISISKLKHDFDSLIELMRHDLAFWSPPSDVPTPTGSC